MKSFSRWHIRYLKYFFVVISPCANITFVMLTDQLPNFVYLWILIGVDIFDPEFVPSDQQNDTEVCGVSLMTCPLFLPQFSNWFLHQRTTIYDFLWLTLSNEAFPVTPFCYTQTRVLNISRSARLKQGSGELRGSFKI